jgi:hypothetical protein
MGASQALVQKRAVCVASADCCFVADALTWPRARLATLLALLNHRLVNGFLFVHGFAIGNGLQEVDREDQRLVVGRILLDKP